MAVAIEARGIGKSFSGVQVLRDVSFAIAPGEALGIVGENGAGKSTLMNIVGGVVRPDTGVMSIDGVPYAPGDPAEAAGRGVAFVHQELNLFANLTIAENLFMGRFPRRHVLGMRLLDRRAMRERARAVLAEVDLDLSPDTRVERLSQGERQIVEIAKALNADARVVIFDEPTTSLADRECRRLFDLVVKLRARGVAVAYISHTLDDVLRLCGQVLVLRDGEVAAAGAGFSKRELIAQMVGRDIEQLYPVRTGTPRPEIALEARGLSHPAILENVGLDVHAGEVVGVAGLMGSGRSELARILFGLDPCDGGEILLGGRDVTRLSTRERIRRGMAYLTEDRRADGLLMEGGVAANLTLVTPRRDRVAEVARDVRLRCSDLFRQPVKDLSGGNQQKVVLGKWLMSPPVMFVLDEPTRGIDVGAKHEVYRILHDLADRGVGLLVISSEIEELIGICDRILVMRKGEIRAAMDRSAFDRERILAAAI